MPRQSPIHSSILLASGAVRPLCGRCWRVPAVAHPLKTSCSRCSPLLAVSSSRIVLALFSQFHKKSALAPSPTARHVTTGRQPRSRSLVTRFQRPKSRVGWRRCESRMWRSAGPPFAQLLRDGDCEGAGRRGKSGYSRVRHRADTSKDRHGSGRRDCRAVKAEAVVCRHHALAQGKRYDGGRGVSRGG